MWTCRYCGSNQGMYYKDQQLEGMLCLAPECGRFNNTFENSNDLYDSDV